MLILQLHLWARRFFKLDVNNSYDNAKPTVPPADPTATRRGYMDEPKKKLRKRPQK